MRPRLRLVLAGAAIDNGNRGVEALGLSVVQGIHEAAPDSDLTILDDGWGVRPDRSLGLEGVRADLVGVRRSRRWYRPESWARVRWSLAVGGGRNPVAERLVRAHAVLDISGGDSFTDTYGPTRLRTICAPKHAALHARRPLVLLPQTIGPFLTRQGRSVAANIVRRVALAYARDPDSYERLLALAGPDVDRDRLRQGVDVAFALGATAPDEGVQALLDRRDGEALVGVNVSGLLLSPGLRDRFGVHDDYLATMVEVVRRLVREEGARVALVPHVHVPGGGGESDRVAIEALLSQLDERERARVFAVPGELHASQLKWCIAQTDWFVGSRMHATIAGLSSGVPTFGYAYSGKTEGVFATCGMSSHVADARAVSGEEAVRLMTESFAARDRTRDEMQQKVSVVTDLARRQLVDLVREVSDWPPPPGRGGVRP
ncbi:MAG TPA: polysaccharide pyruvyl transferase family protein [Propionibacterium sp.]|nr:polysaccharide pyruvyl transferase family protein [Propionibacterium sp.]